ncbi:MAG: hypothetical protein HW373_1366 [Deltaproteobacteria bacterium]|jgi:hypothetical protein|nr:hypothetical protein [Deltaproteobacteria bacterium]
MRRTDIKKNFSGVAVVADGSLCGLSLVPWASPPSLSRLSPLTALAMEEET